MQKQVLDYAGKIIIEDVRDTTISQWEMIVSGKMKSERAKRIFNLMNGEFTGEQIGIIRDLIPQIVDTSIHNFLLVFENSKIFANISMEDGSSDNIALLSDSLSGELYTEDGWISKYSSKNFTPPR